MLIVIQWILNYREALLSVTQKGVETKVSGRFIVLLFWQRLSQSSAASWCMPLIYHEKRWIVLLNNKSRVQQTLGSQICLINNLKLLTAEVELAKIIELQTYSIAYYILQLYFPDFEMEAQISLTLKGTGPCQICRSALLRVSALYAVWLSIINFISL